MAKDVSISIGLIVPCRTWRKRRSQVSESRRHDHSEAVAQKCLRNQLTLIEPASGPMNDQDVDSFPGFDVLDVPKWRMYNVASPLDPLMRLTDVVPVRARSQNGRRTQC